jgi:hypothetical protein
VTPGNPGDVDFHRHGQGIDAEHRRGHDPRGTGRHASAGQRKCLEISPESLGGCRF